MSDKPKPVKPRKAWAVVNGKGRIVDLDGDWLKEEAEAECRNYNLYYKNDGKGRVVRVVIKEDA